MCAPVAGTGKVAVRRGVGRAQRRARQRRIEHRGGRFQGFVRPPTCRCRRAAGAGEVVTFSRDRPPAVQSTLWATALGNQIVTVPFANAYDAPVTIWVVAGPFATTQQTALLLWQPAQQIFAGERLGVLLSPVEIVDATANAKAADLGRVHLRRRQCDGYVDRGGYRRATRAHQRLHGRSGGRLDRAGRRLRHRRRFVAIAAGFRRGALPMNWGTTSDWSTSTTWPPTSAGSTSCTPEHPGSC